MRWVLRIVVVLAVLVAVIAGGVALIPDERIAALATAQFQRLTGRELRIEGGVSPRFWPVLGVATGPVSIANADWSGEDGPMFAADRLVIEINASALLGGDIRILGLSVDRPRILLERAKDGRENWVFGGGSAGEGAGEVSAATPGVGRAYTLEKGLIRGGTIRFVDHAAGRDVTLDDVDLDLAIPDFAGPFTIEASAVTAGQKAAVTAEIGAFSAFTEGRVVPVTLSATAGGSRLAFDGRAGWQPLVAEGALEADLADLPAVSALAGLAPPDLPQGLGRDRLAMTGRFTLDEAGAFYLRDAMIEADGNRLSGDLDLAPGKDRPKLSASLRSSALAFSTGAAAPAASGGGGGAPAPVAETGWSKVAIDVSGLGAMDAAVALVAGSVDLGGLKLGETRMVVTLDRARAVFDLAKVAAYGGEITGQFVANGRGGLSVGGDLMFANLQMQDLLSDLIGWDRLISQGNLNVKFLGVGNSVDAIMKSLKGEGRLALGKGEVRGLDIAGMLRTLDTSYVGEGQKTIFDGVSGSFSMAEGVLSNGDLKLQAPYLVATGAGTVGLGARNLDYSIRPVAFPGQDGTGGVMVPLRITGAWADPTFHLDLESIAREKMEAEAKAAEKRAKAELEKKLQAELGIERAEGESLEDAAKRRAQEALEKEAGKLLEGLLGGN